jgi:hypothetical protein
MHVVAPDLLEDVRQLSVGTILGALALGLLLWSLGWWGHRFWIALTATLAAGVAGLSVSPEGVQPLVTGLLMGVAAGAMALELGRAVAFAAGGLTGWLAVRAVAPVWNEPMICFLAGGLAGLLLFRIWTTALTSAAGTLLMAYAGLCLLDRLRLLDALAVARQKAGLLNGVCGVVAFLGLLLQFALGRRRRAEEADTEEKLSYRRPRSCERAARKVA